ncbi:hypothetical protein O181_024931 [Austropuccinia psidii MF-1]|uniref:Uncharacterized protein n=1 Tax=Austropuccinia psidii MF-1 TaxID=1389203 RepID=A0A9Q3GZ28_9BASI|nr:hypothetical protein [Austropuccinia psidii MF-1]
MRLRHFPPSLPSQLLMLPHPCRLPSLCSCSTLKMRLQCGPHHSLHFCTPASSSPWLTILTLLQGPQVLPLTLPSPPLCLLAPSAYHPYARRVPSQHASDAAYHPYACIVPSRHASDAAYNPCACIVPSRHASDAAYHPYARSALLTCLQYRLLSLCLCSALPTCLQHPPHTGLILNSTYDPYASAAPSR